MGEVSRGSKPNTKQVLWGLLAAVILCAGIAAYGRFSVRREEQLKKAVREIRAAILSYQADTGVSPSALTDLVGGNPDPPWGYRGPYLRPGGGIAKTGVPRNPFVLWSSRISDHWEYDNDDGGIMSAIKVVGGDGSYPDLSPESYPRGHPGSEE
jgi:hypothetical protein